MILKAIQYFFVGLVGFIFVISIIVGFQKFGDWLEKYFGFDVMDLLVGGVICCVFGFMIMDMFMWIYLNENLNSYFFVSFIELWS